MYRHVRQHCKIANSESGMEMLMEHTLHKQMQDLQQRIESQNAKIEHLTGLLEKQLECPPAASKTSNAPKRVTRQSNNTNNSNNNNNNVNNSNNNNSNNTAIQTINNINIKAFGGPGWLIVPVAMVRQLFTNNPRLNDYCRMNYMDQGDPEKALPYVVEGLMEILRGEHADPMARNVYLNPKRVDQVMVFVERNDEATWEVRTLQEVTRMLFDGVASGLNRIIRSHTERAQLPPELHGGVAMMPQMYESDPELYVKSAKGPMSAHLSNFIPPGDASNTIKPAAKKANGMGSGAALPPPAPPALPQKEQEAVAPRPVRTPPIPEIPKKAQGGSNVKNLLASKPPPAQPEKLLSDSAPLTPETAAAALCAKRPKKAGEVDAKYVKALQASIVPKPELGRLITKLWEAKEDGILNDEDAATASAICTIYDANPNAFGAEPPSHKMK